MNEPIIPPPMPQKRGCLSYCLITLVILLVVAGVAGFFGVRFVKNKITAYTSSQATTMPMVDMTTAEYQALLLRVKAFNDGLAQGKGGETLILGENDINALITMSPEGKELAGKVHVKVKGDSLTGTISFPLTPLGWLGAGRYLNGEATFNVSLEDGVMIVTAQDVQVNGEAIPESVMSAFRKENLAKDIYKDPENAAAIRKFESIQIKDSKVIIKSRSPESNQGPGE